MKTELLIDILARGAGPAPRALAARRLAPVAAAGLLTSALLALVLMGPLPGSMFATPAPWIKLGYTGLVVLAAGWLVTRASLPIARVEAPRWALLAVLLTMAAVGAGSLIVGSPSGRLDALMGHSWLQCPWNVLALSLPALGLSLWAVRGLAPTRPVSAGFAAGLFAGGLGAFGYSLSCPEASPAFVAVWYTLGIVLTGLLGAALGPRLLRW